MRSSRFQTLEARSKRRSVSPFQPLIRNTDCRASSAEWPALTARRRRVVGGEFLGARARLRSPRRVRPVCVAVAAAGQESVACCDLSSRVVPGAMPASIEHESRCVDPPIVRIFTMGCQDSRDDHRILDERGRREVPRRHPATGAKAAKTARRRRGGRWRVVSKSPDSTPCHPALVAATRSAKCTRVPITARGESRAFRGSTRRLCCSTLAAWRWARHVTTGRSSRCGCRRPTCREAGVIRSTSG